MPRLLVLIGSIFVVTLSSAASAAAQDLIITNARIIVGSGATIDRGSIVVRNGRIVSVAPGAPTGGSGQTIDAKGMTALPGFIDAHRHIMGGNDAQWFKEQSVPRMQEFLDAGYTTLMSGGGPVPGILELKKRVDSGALKGPRIITSGRVDPDNFKTEELARAQVRKYAEAGIEIIKARIDPEPTPLQLSILKVVVDEGKRTSSTRWCTPSAFRRCSPHSTRARRSLCTHRTAAG